MSLIQLLKFRKVETGLYKIFHFEMPHLQMEVFKTGKYSCLWVMTHNFVDGRVPKVAWANYVSSTICRSEMPYFGVWAETH